MATNAARSSISDCCAKPFLEVCLRIDVKRPNCTLVPKSVSGRDFGATKRGPEVTDRQ
jgi:hypothetical protein